MNKKEDWNERLSELLSNAVNLEHTAFYFYLSVGAYFDTQEKSLLNLRDYFYKESDDELAHAKIVIQFINQRGLKLSLNKIVTESPKGLSVKEIFEKAVEFEKLVLDNYLKIHEEAVDENDAVTTQFVDYFIDKQVKEIKDFQTKAKNAERCECPLGEFIFDQSFSKK